jgi:hypothetical protein
MPAETRIQVETNARLVQRDRRGTPGRLDHVLKPVVEVGAELPRLGRDRNPGSYLCLFPDRADLTVNRSEESVGTSHVGRCQGKLCAGRTGQVADAGERSP